MSPISSILLPPKAVPYCKSPARTPAFPETSSIILPTVMREGKPCGFMMMSGVMPWSVKGMSVCGAMRPTTPFWPWREENLSPTSGRRVWRVRTLMILWSESMTLTRTLSM